ncbi:hypothetical protein PtA15_15A181 [Puccinia triticina]|uniref:Uncharacterized protein n=1 Tax=Puccinia triticina TaxID=208348 RepID=A0ABY7D2F7_9BASI|nr:uncharacterized protein PtA15_15A181 [Puccinia triticina]WAQ91789.1 hypothetical protein PtA15_15A181 [Puccinia triticina]
MPWSWYPLAEVVDGDVPADEDGERVDFLEQTKAVYGLGVTKQVAEGLAELGGGWVGGEEVEQACQGNG